MTTHDDDRQVHAFVDGELELGRRLEFEDRMRRDAGLARRVDDLARLRDAIRDHADYHAAPPALRAPRRSPAPRAAVAAVRRWFDGRALAASFGVVALVAAAAGVVGLRASQADRLLDEVVASHVRSTLGDHLVDVASSDHHTVKPWLSSKLDFSPPVSELRLPGSVFLGGRVDYLDGHPVAALVYRQGPHVVNAFVWPSGNGDRAPAFAEARGFRTAHWSAHGMAHWVISDVNAEEFGAVVAAMRRADADAAGS